MSQSSVGNLDKTQNVGELPKSSILALAITKGVELISLENLKSDRVFVLWMEYSSGVTQIGL